MSTSAAPNPMSASLLAELSGSFEHAPWALVASSGGAHIVRYANSAFCRLVDKGQNEVIGSPFDTLTPLTDECLELVDQVYRTGEAASYTAEETASPSPLFFAYTLWPVKAQGRTAGVMIQVNETGPLHETRQAISQALLLGALRQHKLIEAANSANARLQTEVGRREQLERDAKMLTKEVSHRVKNNLQVVVALITNEIKRTPAPWVDGYLAIQRRIMAIAQLYDLISQSSLGEAVSLRAYLQEIAKTLSASVLGERSGIRIAVEAEALVIDSKRAVPFGLLVNELGTNAVKHAFPGGSGQVTLCVRRVGNEIELTVADDGIGRAPPGQEDRPGKHGTDYVAIFVRQLEGTVVRSAVQGVGTTVNIRFPLSSVGDASPGD